MHLVIYTVNIRLLELDSFNIKKEIYRTSNETIARSKPVT